LKPHSLRGRAAVPLGEIEGLIIPTHRLGHAAPRGSAKSGRECSLSSTWSWHDGHQNPAAINAYMPKCPVHTSIPPRSTFTHELDVVPV
jgi:hypothetical protein